MSWAVIATSSPNRPTVTGMSAIQDAKYGIGAQVPIVATFSAEVTVDFAGDPTDIPQLELETGDDDGVAEYMSGSGGDELTFIYTVVEGHYSPVLNSVGSDSLKPKNYGAIRRKNIPGRGRQADLTLPVTNCPSSLACSNVLIDGVRPTAIGDIMEAPRTGVGGARKLAGIVGDDAQPSGPLPDDEKVIVYREATGASGAGTTDVSGTAAMARLGEAVLA